MTVEELVRGAEGILDHTQPLFDYLWDVMQAQLDQGVPAEELVAVLESLHDRYGRQEDYDAQDEVSEVLNSLTGYCSPTACLVAS